MRSVPERFFPLHDGNNCRRTFEAIARLKERNKKHAAEQRAYQLIYDWTKTAAPLQSARGAEEWSDGLPSVCLDA